MKHTSLPSLDLQHMTTQNLNVHTAAESSLFLNLHNYFWKNNVFTPLVCCLYSSLGFYYNMFVLMFYFSFKFAINLYGKDIATPFVFSVTSKQSCITDTCDIIPACKFPHTCPWAVQRSLSNEKQGFLDHVKIQCAYYIENLHLHPVLVFCL